MSKLRTGHYVGDPTAPFDPKNIVEKDGLSANQREWLGKIEKGHRENNSIGIWTSKYAHGRWWTREEWEARGREEPVAPSIQSFKEEWYPAFGRMISSQSELNRLCEERGLQPKY